jgi:hypothetical protein
MVVKMKNLMTGYKATDKDMKCRGFQFELGKWFEHEGELVECQSGFHFCEQPSGPWAYYQDPGTRIFKVECEGVLEKPFAPGADAKRVCKRIRFVEEINVTGDSNTGHRNTGNWNATDRSNGFFCIHEPKVCSFDFQTELTYEQFLESFPESFDLGSELHQPFEIDFAKYARIPGITPEKLKELHRKHLAAKESKEQVK